MAKSQGYEPALRELPGVDRLAAQLDGPRPLAVTAARRAIEECRAEIRSGASADPLARARKHLAGLQCPSLGRVINATGVILHTGLGRAVLPRAAQQAVADVAAGYCNLELGLATGERVGRAAHISALLRELTGAEAGLAVNNGAGATLLAVAALAGRAGRVVVSRGQLVEIGGGFRVPEVIAQAGARLVEVGTTNRTRLADYADAVACGDVEGGGRGMPGQTIVLRVHPSNFRMQGFTETVGIDALCRLGVPVVDDLGAGALHRASVPAREEPDVRESVRVGVALAAFSGDKLLGGPQAGILVGRADAIAAAAQHPLARALRIDKLSLAALEATLRLHLDPERAAAEIPALRMLNVSEAELGARAAALAAACGSAAEVVRTVSRVGGGALALAELPGPAVLVALGALKAEAVAATLRQSDPPVLARIREGGILLDPRTVGDEQVQELAAAVRRAAGL